MVERVEFTNMCMISDGQGSVVVQDRADDGWPGIAYPGGHVEKGESFESAVIREVYEETGLTVIHPELVGIKQFQTRENTRYVVLMYKATQYAGEIKSSDEGRVFWMKESELKNARLASGFYDIVVFYQGNYHEMYYKKNESGAEELTLF